MALVMLSGIAALAWKQLSAAPALSTRAGRLPHRQAPPPAPVTQTAGASAPRAAPVELPPPQSVEAVTQPQALPPPQKAAVPRVKSATKPRAQEPTAPQPATPALKESFRPPPTELPGRNHGF
jgi:hypothetical protein